MSVGYLTSNSLINQIKLSGMVPTSQNTFSDADFLSIANQEIKLSILPSILQYHEEYYVRDTTPISLVANTSNYAIPYRAVGGKFRNIFYRDTSGNLYSMSRISPEDRPYYQQNTVGSNHRYFYISGNDVVLVPDVGANPVGSLVFSYYMRPNDMVLETRIGTITGISEGTSTTTYTLDRIPSSLTTFYQDGVALTGFSTSSRLDMLQRRPGHKTLAFDILPTALDSVNLTITFNNDDVPEGLIIGDYIAFAGECIIPQVPSDLHEMLTQRVLKRVMQALGDDQGMKMAIATIGEMEKNSGILVDNRAEGQPLKVVNKGGLLNQSKIGRRWW